MLISFGLLFFLAGCSQSGDVNINEPIPTSNELNFYNHEGNLFSYSTTGVMNSLDVLYFMGCPNGSKEIHFDNYEIIADGNPILVEFFENPTINTTNGTLVNPYVMNRNFNTNATMSLYLNPDVINDGTRLFIKSIVGSQNKDVGSSIGVLGWTLNNTKCYAFKITNNNGNGVNIYSNFIWHEHLIN